MGLDCWALERDFEILFWRLGGKTQQSNMVQEYCYIGKPHCESTERRKEAILYGLFERIYTVARFLFCGCNE